MSRRPTWTLKLRPTSPGGEAGEADKAIIEALCLQFGDKALAIAQEQFDRAMTSESREAWGGILERLHDQPSD